MKKIITHAGKAHLDDYMACAIALAVAHRAGDIQTLSDVPVERRDPTAYELDDPSTWVMDIGGVLDPEIHCWDHHQLPRGNKECAMTLLAESLGLRDRLGKLFPWFETRGELDATGPFATSQARGLKWTEVAPFLGPFEDIVLERFMAEPAEAVLPMAARVEMALDAYDRVQPAIRVVHIDGVGVTDFTQADDKDVRVCQEAFLPDNGVAVFLDDRGPGLTLLRINDDPRIDFSRVKDDPNVGFAHANGFICKTRTRDHLFSVGDLIRKAIVV